MMSVILEYSLKMYCVVFDEGKHEYSGDMYGCATCDTFNLVNINKKHNDFIPTDALTKICTRGRPSTIFACPLQNNPTSEELRRV